MIKRKCGRGREFKRKIGRKDKKNGRKSEGEIAGVRDRAWKKLLRERERESGENGRERQRERE